MRLKKFFLSIIFSIPVFTFQANSQEQILKLIENNWNDTRTLSGSFTQINSDQSTTYGDFFISKPFNSKFIYKNDDIIITSKSLITIVDQDGYKIDSYPIFNSPLRFFLTSEIDFGNLNLSFKVTEKDNIYLLSASELNNDKKVYFSFHKESLELKKWEIIDEFSQSTVLEFTKIKKNISISPDIYAIKYKRN